MSQSRNAAGALSRRRLIFNLGVLGGAVGLAGVACAAKAAPAKLDQRSAAYQPTPKGKARCDNCVQWQAPNACKVVAGVIAPAGWCVLYAPQSAARKSSTHKS